MNVVVVGGLTHMHGMTRPTSRDEARNWVNDPAKTGTLEPTAPGTRVREWIDGLGTIPALCAAFDTRMDIARVLSGAASGHIEQELTK